MQQTIRSPQSEFLLYQTGSLRLAVLYENEKNRQNAYSAALVQNDAKELMRLIKTTLTRKNERLKKGRTATTVDEHFLKSAEHALYGELAYALGIEGGNMVEFIKARISK